MVKSSGRIYFVRTADIDWCEAAGNYVRVHVGTQEHLVRETMSHSSRSSIRSSSSASTARTIVNVDRIQELRSSFNGEHSCCCAPARG